MITFGKNSASEGTNGLYSEVRRRASERGREQVFRIVTPGRAMMPALCQCSSCLSSVAGIHVSTARGHLRDPLCDIADSGV